MSFPRSSLIFALAAVALLTAVVGAQTKRKTPTKKTAVTVTAPTPSPSPVEPVVVQTGAKKNERPAGDGIVQAKPNQRLGDMPYRYEFAQPEFTISKIVIEHDDAGRGTITFTKKMFSDTFSDPIEVSPAALERINGAFSALQFLDSNESYQYEKDYSHLGVTTFRLKHGDKQRTAVFNYTVNKDAKVLADEYRKIGNQYIWMFDLSVARQNQPLETPRLLDSLESLLRLNEISDSSQLIPLLKSMIDDERVPLIARNHAAKLVERLGKKKGG